jgi:hypothetical protein
MVFIVDPILFPSAMENLESVCSNSSFCCDGDKSFSSLTSSSQGISPGSQPYRSPQALEISPSYWTRAAKKSLLYFCVIILACFRLLSTALSSIVTSYKTTHNGSKARKMTSRSFSQLTCCHRKTGTFDICCFVLTGRAEGNKQNIKIRVVESRFRERGRAWGTHFSRSKRRSMMDSTVSLIAIGKKS